jgi:hypothetical protein
MSIRVMSWVFENEEMDSNQKLVALALADHCHDDGSEARPGLARIERKTSLSRRTIQRTIKSLLDDGWIVMDRPATYNRPPHYRFVMGCRTVTPPVEEVSHGHLGGVTNVAEGCLVVTQTIKEPSIKHQGDSLYILTQEDHLESVRKAREALRSRSALR